MHKNKIEWIFLRFIKKFFDGAWKFNESFESFENFDSLKYVDHPC